MTWVPTSAACATDAPPSIDVEALFARCMGNQTFGEILLAEFEDTAFVHIETIEGLLAQEDFRGIARAARFLEGAADILAAGAIQKTAQQIEEASVTYRHADVPPLVRRLHQEMSVCLADLPAIRERFAELAEGVVPF